MSEWRGLSILLASFCGSLFPFFGSCIRGNGKWDAMFFCVSGQKEMHSQSLGSGIGLTAYLCRSPLCSPLLLVLRPRSITGCHSLPGSSPSDVSECLCVAKGGEEAHEE